MKAKMMKGFFVVLFFSALTYSCNGNRLYEEFSGFQSLSWAKVDTVSFTMEGIQETNTLATVGIRYNDSYEFHNLYLRLHLKDSLGNVKQDSLINISLFDAKTGKPLGKGFGNRLTVYDTLPLGNLPDKSTVEFIQYMRKDTLVGIEAVGLKVMKES